jgi:26S proteasome regulatory subunit N2
LLHDTQPDEPKTLLELKVKKARVQPAPDAATAAAAAAAGASADAAMRDDAAFEGGQGIVDQGYMLDEGVEGEAEVPGDFEYESDGEGLGEDAMEE